LGDYDLVHVEFLFDWPLIASALITKCLRRTPHVVDFVDLIDALVGPSKRRSFLYKIGYLPTWATVVSDYLGSHLVSKGFAKKMIFKIPMGIDSAKVHHLQKEEAREVLGLAQEQRLIGFELGTGMWDEYVDLALTSFREVLRHKDGVKFAFIGHAEGWSDRIRDRINSMGLDREVICTGILRTEELSPWLGACDVLILPLRDTAYDKARVPGRFGDYLAAGRPIVGACVGETQDILRRGCGLLAEPSNHIDFASKILTILEDENLMREMGEAGRRLAENDYSWKSVAAKLEQAYETIIAA
jgi:glycosyltransferase involved in cell wall biosynthesis